VLEAPGVMHLRYRVQTRTPDSPSTEGVG
jgi:hypothetical protein